MATKAGRGDVPELTIASRAYRRLGPVCLALGILDRWLRLVTPLRILVVVTHPIDAVRPAAVRHAEGLTAYFLTPQQARDLASDDDRWYSPAFVAEALAMGDRCLGIFEGDRLLSYCWYSSGPTPALGDLLVSVDARYLYSYKAYTDVKERGRGLHGYGVAEAAAQLAAEGEVRGIVAYIEASNLSSLLSAQKLGDKFVGFVVLGRIAGVVRTLMSPGCATVGFRVHQAATPDQPDPAGELNDWRFSRHAARNGSEGRTKKLSRPGHLDAVQNSTLD